jgi:FkbM family methyltransferase
MKSLPFKTRFKLFKTAFKSKIRHFWLKRFGKHAEAVFYRSENGLFVAPPEDMYIAFQLGKQGSYNLPEIEVLQKFIPTNQVVYVLGTHIGTLLIPIAKQAKQVVGYEANPNTFNYLAMNLQINVIQNTQIFNCAVGNQTGEVEFYMNIANSGGSKIKPREENYAFTFDNPQTTKVQIYPLDKHILDHQLPQPDAIIMDIEGAELYALQGMPNALKHCRVLYMEYTPQFAEQVSGVKVEEFAKMMSESFDKMQIMEDILLGKPQEYSQNEFAKIFKELREKDRFVNLLMYKS